ncbi:MAG: hypothetical protein HFK04_05680 [Oscillospiraceae bacterium]|jgi:flagellar FliJ protein|nr:hypothetical protein [Oscillospiraceae bacterium]
MKKFQFSLSHMREYKDRILDEELGVLQRLKGERDQIQQKIDNLNREFQSISLQMLKAQEKGSTIMEVRGYNVQLTNIRMQLQDLESALQRAAKKVFAQTQVVVAANQEVSKLDKLQDRQYEAYRQHMQKEEELRIEELVTLGLSRQNVG